MIVKFFSKPKNGGGAKSSIDYLINQNKHDNKAEILQGDPDLSRKLAESLDFETTYTVGCLSFEEKADQLTDEQKREIMDRFEQAIFSSLDKEQYNILWVQHSDKNRLELNFFIPNVELTSGKRLQPYYDKADRPIVENFKQVINYEFKLTDPNAPEKQQTLITRKDLPKPKREALESINNGIEGLVKAGEIKSREDVIHALEKAGFEIARVTQKNISIKTEGQNLRLKGAFYEQDFRCSKSFRTDSEKRVREYERDSQQRYQTARERLDKAVSRRKQEFGKRYPNRASAISKEISESFQFDKYFDVVDLPCNSNSIDSVVDEQISRDAGVAKLCGAIQEEQQRNKTKNVRNGGRQNSDVRSTRSSATPKDVGGQKSDLQSNRNGELSNDRNRKTIRERIEGFIKAARERFKVGGRRIEKLTQRKRIDQGDVQRNDNTKRKNQQSLSELSEVNQIIRERRKTLRERKKTRTKNPKKGIER